MNIFNFAAIQNGRVASRLVNFAGQATSQHNRKWSRSSAG
jgi:hypothetical protein